VDGHLRIQVSDGPVHEVQSGGLALFPHNDYHLPGGDLGLPPIPSGEVVNPRPAVVWRRSSWAALVRRHGLFAASSVARTCMPILL